MTIILFKIWPTNRFSKAKSCNFHFHKNDVTRLLVQMAYFWLFASNSQYYKLQCFSISLDVLSLISGANCISRKVRRGAYDQRYFLLQVGGLPEGLLRLIFLGMCCWPLRTPTPLKSSFGRVIDPILVTFGQILFLQSQLSHLLFVHLPYKAF